MDKIDGINHNYKLVDGFSAETSGGILAIFKKEDAENFVEEMKANGHIANVIGYVVEGERKAKIVEPEIIYC